MIRAVHSVGRLDLEGGGTSQSVTNLCKHLADIDGIRIALVSQSLVGMTTVPVDDTKVDVFIGQSRSRFSARLGLAFRGALCRALGSELPTIFHDHGVWRPSNHYVARMATRRSIPLVIHPRGMLEPWALAYRPWKKKIALRLYLRRNLESAALFFATAEQELEQLRRLNLRQPIAVIPNGVKVPSSSSDNKIGVPTVRNAVFMSRIHPKKGLINLIDAWACLRPGNWRLLLAGPDEDGHLNTVMRRIKAAELDRVVQYVGVVDGQRKSAFLEGADLFILPSYSENFGLVIAEALANGVPVITTTATPWQSLERERSGWWIEPTLNGLIAALREALTMSPAALRQMGLRGRAQARALDWNTIAQQTADVYHWVLHRGPRPACVVIE
jgi:glycosyltransferase involved in cell wall biosynthesis